MAGGSDNQEALTAEQQLASRMDNGWTLNRHGSFRRSAGGFDLAITDQRYRGCGWCWHVSLKEPRYDDGGEIAGGAGKDNADAAKQTAEQYVREFCERALAAFEPQPLSGGPTERHPNRPYCKPDQSCCDFTCGN